MHGQIVGRRLDVHGGERLVAYVVKSLLEADSVGYPYADRVASGTDQRLVAELEHL